MPSLVRAFAVSDIGLLRERNEDAWAALPDCEFYILADGMGGHQSGDVAARLAVDTLIRLVRQRLTVKGKTSLEEAFEFISSSIQLVNAAVYREGISHPALVGMGTTLCCLYFNDQGIVWAHVGDSRIYRLRKRKLQSLTKDHSLFRELVEGGEISEREERSFGYKNVITRAIGTEGNVEPTLQTGNVQVGDLYLLCSDGLTDMLTNQEIEEIMNRNLPVDQYSTALVEAAKEAGGHDNITVIVIQLDEASNLP